MIDVPKVRLFNLPQVDDESAACHQSCRAFLQPLVGDILIRELLGQNLQILGTVKQPLLPHLGAALQSAGQDAPKHTILRCLAAQQHFSRRKASQFVDDFFHSAAALTVRGIKHAGGHIAERNTPITARAYHAGDVVILAFLQHGAFRDGTGRNHPDDLPLHQSLCQSRVLHLFADSNLIAPSHQPRNIALAAVEGNAAHRHPLLCGFASVPGGQGQIQLLGRQLCVLVEHLIEIPQPEEQDAVRILFLDLQILLHHGGKFCHYSASSICPTRLQVVLSTIRTCRKEPTIWGSPGIRTSRPPSVLAVS